MTLPIPPQDLPLLRRAARSAILLVLLLRFGELPSIRQTAALLHVDRRTARACLRDLERLGLIQPQPGHYGYRLAQPLSEEQRRLIAYFCPSHPALAHLPPQE